MNLKSSEPFWLVKNGLLNSYPSLRTQIKADMLIVGGGITGSLIAHQCIEDGYKTILVDKREIANGSTSATTSMLQYEIDMPLYKLISEIGENGAVKSYWACHEAIDKLEALVRQIKSDSGYKRKDSLYFAARRKDVSWLKKEFNARKKYGFSVQWLEAPEIRQKYHFNNTYGGILSSQGASMDAFRFTHDLLAYNQKRGLEIYDKTNIEKVNYQKGNIEARTEYGNIIKAKKIIYCNGYESVNMIKDKFVNLLSTFAIVSERNDQDLSYLNSTLVWNTAKPYIYMRTTDDNRILIGGGDEKFINTEKRDKLLLKKQQDLEKQLQDIFPDPGFRTDFVWAGTFGETKDGLPYIGAHPDFSSAYFVLGFGGNGITFSVTGMDMVSKMLEGKPHPLADYFKFKR